MPNRFVSIVTVWFFAGALEATSLGGQVRLQPVQVNRSRLEKIEELSESFANDMLELSSNVRSRDLRRIADFFADSLEAQAFPSHPGDLKTGVKRIRNHEWTAAIVLPSGKPMKDT